MKAIVFEGKEIVSYKDVIDPKMSADEVLIKVKYCGLCGSDIASYLGNMPYINAGKQKYPFIPGHEWSGQVIDVGKNVIKIKKGDRVTGDVSVGCGNCPECLAGNYHLCDSRVEVGNLGNKPGGMAQYIVMPERHLYKLPDSVEFMGGAIVEPLATALHGLDRKKIGFNENILITGTGLIGILAAQVAGINLNSKVVLTGRTKEKLDVALQCGVKNTINIIEVNLQNYLKSLELLDKITFCIECSGNISALKQCIDIVKPGGHISIIGFFENYKEIVDIDKITMKNLEIHGVLASPNFFNSALLLLEKKLVHYKPIISKVFELKEIKAAIDYLLDKNNRAMKVMLNCDI